MKTNPDDLAFDTHFWQPDALEAAVKDGYVCQGMTKREYFAAVAMGGLLNHFGDAEKRAEESVKNADALIVELNK